MSTLELPPPEEPPSEDFMLWLLARDTELGLVYAE
jgi:hypothetical protein